MIRMSLITCVIGQFTDGSHGSWVTKCDPWSAVDHTMIQSRVRVYRIFYSYSIR